MKHDRIVALVFVALVATTAIAPLGVVALTPEDGPKRAELSVHQPHYADGRVGEKDNGNLTVYKASGRVLRLQPENFNSSDVVSVSVAEDVGSISYAPDRDVFVLDTGGTDGTYTVTWVVREEVEREVVENDTTKTVNETVRRRYAAVLSVDNTNLAHLPSDQVKSLRSDAENWSEVAELYGSVGNPNKPIEQKLEFGARLVEAVRHPWKALTGDFGMAIQAVFFSAGGLIFFILWNIPHLIRSRRLRKENKELKEKIGDYEAIDEALDEIFTEKRKQYLREKSFNDWFDDRTSAWLRRNFAPDPWAAFRELATMLSPSHLNSIVAGAMLDSDRFVLIVERETDFRTDGGDADVDRDPDADEDDVDQELDDASALDELGDVVSARMARSTGDHDVDVHDLDLDESERLVTDSDDLTLEITRQIETESLDSEVLLNGDVELRSVALPVGNTPDDDDLIAQLNVSIPEDFETREHFADVLATIIKKVAASDYSDPDGTIRPERDLANFLMGITTIYGESYEQEYLKYVRDLMLHNLDRLDASERTRSVVEEARDRKDQGASS